MAAAGVVVDVRYLRRRVDMELSLAGYVPGRRRGETGFHLEKTVHEGRLYSGIIYARDVRFSVGQPVKVTVDPDRKHLMYLRGRAPRFPSKPLILSFGAFGLLVLVGGWIDTL
ncbi:hypothetical protein [Streptomyces sp. SID11385]|uniref:hypothetical protein n=1 Tax=Streptomyces sp. SID11385 TaxID=2706031 RepID=UPI0013DAB48C|nr:hypothetical protein [Streptomyces sp. SID11385]